MRHADISHYLERRPFTPLRLHMSDGKSFDIKSPEFVFVMNSGLEIGVPRRRNSREVSDVIWCAFIHIARIEVLDRPARKSMAMN